MNRERFCHPFSTFRHRRMSAATPEHPPVSRPDRVSGYGSYTIPVNIPEGREDREFLFRRRRRFPRFF